MSIVVLFFRRSWAAPSQATSRVDARWPSARLNALYPIVHNESRMSNRVQPPTECPAGFTLVELLLVVTIIGALVGLVLPAIQQSRTSARRSECKSNLRQWALAAQNYADVHNGRLPYRGQGVQPTTVLDRPSDWFNALPPFMEGEPYIDLKNRGALPKAGDRSVWICPEAERPSDDDRAAYFAYGMNMALSVRSPNSLNVEGMPDHLARVGALQTMVFMADGAGPYCSVIPYAAAFSPVARHNGIVNIAFLDAHVAAFDGDYVGCDIGVPDPERPDIRWYTPNGTWHL
jgi:prepilin-type N-terminal cleavage/methylation domain-containing protein/prepilin-type processing-associated H-X9-DG protein